MSVFENIGSMVPALITNYGALHDKYRPLIEPEKKREKRQYDYLNDFFLAECAPSNSAWVSSKNGWAGTSFESHIYKICSRTPHACTESFLVAGE